MVGIPCVRTVLPNVDVLEALFAELVFVLVLLQRHAPILAPIAAPESRALACGGKNT